MFFSSAQVNGYIFISGFKMGNFGRGEADALVAIFLYLNCMVL
jgi:hypothetical protein